MTPKRSGIRILTIGGYGFTQEKFLSTLTSAKVDTFVDLRQRRGVRGAQYAFLNSTRLQDALAGAGIKYVYIPELAPPPEIRSKQKAQDAATGIAKRERTALSDEFVRAYEQEVLNKYSADDFFKVVGDGAANVALFCVETLPDACHRSLVAKRLSESCEVIVEHLKP